MACPLDGSVKVVEVSKVAPGMPPPPSSSLPLTYYDVFWLRFSPTQRLFFYETSPNDNANPTQILSSLKQSLSVALRHFFPLAGKLAWPPESDEPFMRYVQGDAVLITVAESSGEEFQRLTAGGFVPAVDYHPLLPELAATHEEVPVMALQVTFFGDEGISVGYTAHHAAIDGKSIAMFIHSWAAICREKGDIDTVLKREHTPWYDRTIISDPRNQRQTFLSRWLNQDGPNNKSLAMMESVTPIDLRRGTFLLTREYIDYLKSSVQAKWKEMYGKEFNKRLTSFMVTVSYVWACLIKSQFTLEEGKNSDDKFYLGFAADERSQKGDPRGSTYFGNCVGLRIVELSLTELWREDGVAMAAKAIGNQVENLKDGMVEELKVDIGSLEPGVFSSIAGSPWFNFYDVDFGWGRPKKVEMISIDYSRAFSLTGSRDSKGGIDVGIVLEKPKIERFASLFASGLAGGH